MYPSVQSVTVTQSLTHTDRQTKTQTETVGTAFCGKVIAESEENTSRLILKMTEKRNLANIAEISAMVAAKTKKRR
jgi:hypothetical protein